MAFATLVSERQARLLSLLAVGALVSMGCGGGAASVSGVVTLDGKPLKLGTVAFTPLSGGKRATGVIDSDGSFELSTNRAEGLEIGDYTVLVTSREPGPPSEGPPMPGPSLIPEHYARDATSGLRFTVESGSNIINIELSSDGGDSPPAGAAR
jgi:hypothetical protein